MQTSALVAFRRLTHIVVVALVAICTTLVTVLPAAAVVGGTWALGNTAVVRILNGSSSCSGALWTSRIVVTAGHCVVNPSGDVTTGAVSVFAPGVSTEQSPQTISQSQIIVVEGFRLVGPTSQPDDIAFIVLASELPGGTITRLATTDEVAAWGREGRIVTFLGYGRTSSNGPSSPVPHRIEQPLTSSTPWPGSFTATQTSTTGICSGDSGGPVITQVGTDLVLIGINSAASGPCSPSSRPSMTGFVPAAFPALVKRALDATSLPLVASAAATSIDSDSVVVSGTVNASSVSTQPFFQLSTVADFSSLVATIVAGDVTGTETASLSANFTGLVAGTTYYWRLAATNAAGTSVGATLTFTTPVFERQTSLSANALLTTLNVDRNDLTKILVMPVAKSKQQCTLNTRNSRLMLNKPGTCRVKLTLTTPTATVVAFYNLAIR